MPKVSIVLATCLTVTLLGCARQEKNKLVVGASPAPHAEILEHAKPFLQRKGIVLEVRVFSDYVTPNLALGDGSIDANFFQHHPYLDVFEASRHIGIVSAGAVHFEPLGLYSRKIKNVRELKDGDRIAVPSDVSNEARALVLLEASGVLTLKDGVKLTATKHDIAATRVAVEIVELDAAQIPRALDDVTAAVINGNYAIEARLHPARDALAIERADSPAARTYANIVAVLQRNANRADIQALVEVLQSPEIRAFITNRYDGAVVPVTTLAVDSKEHHAENQ